MLGGEDIESVNGELRYITIELMKIAAQRKQPFADVAKEFLQNATLLQRMIELVEGSDNSMSRFMQPLPGLHKPPRPPKVKPGTQ
ncbi:Uncharacterised protein [uncultured archaeon]|nr:Uncharacterised protein [uncultured archaeon]